jgi:hypothetical protein
MDGYDHQCFKFSQKTACTGNIPIVRAPAPSTRTKKKQWLREQRVFAEVKSGQRIKRGKERKQRRENAHTDGFGTETKG